MMMAQKQLFFQIVGLLLLCFPVAPIWAQQEVSFIAEAPAEAGLNDQLELTYTIRNAENLRSLNPGKFQDFQILAGPFQGQSTNISIANGQRVQTQTISLTYILKPKRTGKLRIPAAEAKDADNNTYVSNQLTVHIVPGTLAGTPARKATDPFADDPFALLQQRRNAARQQATDAAAGKKPVDQQQLRQDLFMKVEVDKTKAFAGEQITASYKLYTRVPMQVSMSKLPSLNGFWTQDFDIPPTPKPSEEIVDGKKYQVFLIKKSALFPQQTGTLTLDAAEAEGFARLVQKVKQRNPFADMFDNDPFFRQAFGGTLSMNDPFFNEDLFSSYTYEDVPVKLKSEPMRITVSALPAPGPESFDGAVGQFQMKGTWDKTHFSTDEQTTLTLTISGSGNLKLFGAPRLKLPNGLVAYEPQITDTITGRSTAISGKKIIQYTITAHQPGRYTIPALSFSYFDPKSNRYETLSVQGTELNITPGTSLVSHADKNGKANTTAQGFSFWLRQPWVWTLAALPLLAFGFIAFNRRRLGQSEKSLPAETANKQAARRLATAHQFLKQGEATAFYTEISKAVWLYLSQRLEIPLSDLSRQSAFQALGKKAVPEHLTAALIEVIDQCEYALYAPGAGLQHMQQTYQQASSVISQLEGYPGFSQPSRARVNV